MVRSSFGVPLLVLALLLGASAVDAAPSSGQLAFSEVPTLQGLASAVGGGEIVLLPTLAQQLSGAALGATLTRVITEQTVVTNPVGGDLTVEAPSTRTEDVPLGDVSLTLDSVGQSFRGLLFTQAGGRLDAVESRLDDAPLTAFQSPALIVDDYGPADSTREGEVGTFTYRADGARFPFETTAAAATGPMTLFLWDTELVVVDADGTENRYRSGNSRVAGEPGQTKMIREHHMLAITGGQTNLQGDRLVAWLSDPTFTFDGTLRGARASGAIDVEAVEHTLDAVSVTLVGSLQLRPVPTGKIEPVEEGDATHVGTSQPSDGRYAGARTTIDGDVTLLAIGTQQVLAQDTGLGVITAVGVLGLAGAVLLLAPNVKWTIFGVLTPLYAKTQRDRLLDNQSRERIFQAIRNNPGINLSQVHRVAELGWGVTVYHLKMMEKKGLIASLTHARDKCFFENEPRLLALREAIASIANKEPVQRIVRTVADQPGLSQRDVIAATGLTQRTVSYYLSRLSKTGLVAASREKNFVHYQPTDQLLRALEVVGNETLHSVPSASELPAVPA